MERGTRHADYSKMRGAVGVTQRVLIVGSGFVTPFHAAGWRRLAPRMELAAVASPDALSRSALAASFGIGLQYDDLDAALSAVRPDVVDICSPLAFHADHVRAAAAAGAAIICQKPLGASRDEAMATAAAARAAGVRLMVHENFRFRSWVRAAARVLASGEIGRPIFARSSLRFAGTVTSAQHPEVPWSLARQPFFAEMPRLLILESVVHQIDVMRFLLGEPSSIYALARRIGQVRGEDLVTLMLNFADCHAVLERSYASRGQAAPPVASEAMLIEGTEGLLTVDHDGAVAIEIDKPGLRDRRVVAPATKPDYGAAYAATIEHFAARLLDGQPFETDDADNLRTLDATFAAYESLESGEVVRLPTPSMRAGFYGDTETHDMRKV